MSFTIAGYRLQQRGNEPALATAGPKADFKSDIRRVDLDFTDIGKKPARRAVATAFTVDQDRNWAHKRELGRAPIIGAGVNIMPGYNGHAGITFKGEIPHLLLACVVYYDDSDTELRQAFLFDLTTAKANGDGFLNEIETPSSNACT